jgi:hypothetical protein
MMKRNIVKLKSLALVLAMILPLLGLTFTGCTAQEAVDIAAGVAEVALEVLAEADAAEEDVQELPTEEPAELPVSPEPEPEPEVKDDEDEGSGSGTGAPIPTVELQGISVADWLDGGAIGGGEAEEK